MKNNLSVPKKCLLHLKTILHHKRLVAQGCFKIGLYKQGLFHDMSKFSPTEFFVGVKYFQGDRSPNNAEREDMGYSSAWLHHKGRNKHHYEYWVDYNSEAGGDIVVPVPMPNKYIAEMIMDRIAASKTYKGKNYNNSCPLEYLNLGIDKIPIHPETKEILYNMLVLLAEQGEEVLYEKIKKELLNK